MVSLQCIEILAYLITVCENSTSSSLSSFSYLGLDILIGEGGITHKAIMKITKCRILLSSCDHDKCSVTVTGESESRVDHAYTVICDTFAKARVSRRTLDEIRIVDLLGRESGRKRPRRR